MILRGHATRRCFFYEGRFLKKMKFPSRLIVRKKKKKRKNRKQKFKHSRLVSLYWFFHLIWIKISIFNQKDVQVFSLGNFRSKICVSRTLFDENYLEETKTTGLTQFFYTAIIFLPILNYDLENFFPTSKKLNENFVWKHKFVFNLWGVASCFCCFFDK